jgi:hypothetical protein
MESWRAVPGYDGVYEVSDLGRIRSFRRWRGTNGPRLLTPCPNVRRSGHLCVNLYKNGSHRLRPVHQLVLEAFLGPAPPGMVGLHGPNGSADNSLSNLSYGTQKQNSGPDRVRDGTVLRGERAPTARLRWPQVREIRRLVVTGVPQRQLARQSRISEAALSQVVNLNSWWPDEYA